MGLIECKLYSRELSMEVGICVILPTPDSADPSSGTGPSYPREGQRYQTLYLLHGFSQDHWAWCRYSGIERYAQARRLAVVMPAAHNSRYCNLRYGGNHYDYYTRELPGMMRSIFPLSAKRKHNFIAGLSMGGFGAFKAALTNPQSYAAAASLSAGLIVRDETPNSARGKWVKAAYGEHFQDFDPALDYLPGVLEYLREQGGDIPKLYQACGTEDFLYANNIEFRDYARGLGGVDLTFEDGPGAHSWDFWDPFIRRVIEWLPLAGGFVD